jgi:hypothetical protein
MVEDKRELIKQRLEIQSRLEQLNIFLIALHLFQEEGYISLINKKNKRKKIKDWNEEIEKEVAEKLSALDELTEKIKGAE